MNHATKPNARKHNARKSAPRLKTFAQPVAYIMSPQLRAPIVLRYGVAFYGLPNLHNQTEDVRLPVVSAAFKCKGAAQRYAREVARGELGYAVLVDFRANTTTSFVRMTRKAVR